MICGLWKKNKTQEIILLHNATRPCVNLANLNHIRIENKSRITGYKIRVSFAGSPHKRFFIR